jgi:hypothetical protein
LGSLPPHDEYARQFIYRLITNYQDTRADDMWPQARKDQLIIVDFRKSEEEKERLRSTYRFVDWEKSKVLFDGFNHSLIELL